MKTESILLLAAAAIGGFFLLKPRTATTEQGGFSGGTGAPFTASATTPSGQTISGKISSTAQGVGFINTNVSAGNTIQRTSRTIQENVTATVSGQKLTGDIAQLATGKA